MHTQVPKVTSCTCRITARRLLLSEMVLERLELLTHPLSEPFPSTQTSNAKLLRIKSM